MGEGLGYVSSVPHLIQEQIPLPQAVSAVTVLIADTDPDVVEALSGPLEEGGYIVLAAYSERQMFQVLTREQPDLVMLGSRLNTSASETLCSRIKSDQMLGFLPVILLAETGEDVERVSEGADSDPDAVLFKPVQPSELVIWLQSMIRLKEQYDRKLAQLTYETRRLELLRSDLIATISHELSTPLLQVKSAIAMLANGLDDQIAPRQARLADMATQAIARLEHEVVNIKQLARSHETYLTPVQVADAAERAMRYLERKWTSREAVGRIEVLLQDDLPFVLADMHGLSRLLQVLLDNALKFSAVDDPVWLSAECQGDDHVWIAVQDAGIGIATEEHERIFDPFYKVDASATQQYAGSGTGLAVAALLANGMNITIAVDSKPGEGSKFSFALPVVTPEDWLSLL